MDTLNAYTISNGIYTTSVTLEKLKNALCNDEIYQELIHQIREGFPKTRNHLQSIIRPFWEVRHCLTVCDNVISMDDCLVILTSLQTQTLCILHSAQQGVTGMTVCANVSVYWPGINNSIQNTQCTCKSCNEMAPLNPKEPLTLSLPPEWPFQRICADFFQQNHHSYLTSS